MLNIEIKMLQGGSNTIYDTDFMRYIGTQSSSSMYCIYSRGSLDGCLCILVSLILRTKYTAQNVQHNIERWREREWIYDRPFYLSLFPIHRKRRIRKRVDREIYRNRDNVVLIESRTWGVLPFLLSTNLTELQDGKRSNWERRKQGERCERQYVQRQRIELCGSEKCGKTWCKRKEKITIMVRFLERKWM